MLLILGNCTDGDTLITKTEYVKPAIPILAHPREIETHNINWRVITEDNLDAFITELKHGTTKYIFYAVTPGEFNKIVLNINDMKRYIAQQKTLIVYYENSIKEEPNKKEE